MICEISENTQKASMKQNVEELKQEGVNEKYSLKASMKVK